MNTFNILQDALRNRNISERRAVRIAKHRFGGDWAVTKDSRRLQEKEYLLMDMAGNYYECADDLLVVNSANSTTRYITESDFDSGVYRVFRCQLSGKYYDISYTPLIPFDSYFIRATTSQPSILGSNHPSMVCMEYAVNSNLLYEWADNTFRTCLELSEPVVPSASTPGYHSTTRPLWWRQAEGIGMELELYTTDPYKLRENLPADIIAEVDGSIDRTYGLELIGGPYSLKHYSEDNTPWRTIADTARKIGSKGHNAGDGYGIHLSISKSLFSTLHGAKFIVFFNQQSELCQLIAQRTTIYSGDYGIRKKIKDVIYENGETRRRNSYYDPVTREYKVMNALTYNSFGTATNKYEPVRADNKRYEVRIFRSNLRWERILKNIEFVDAVKEYTREGSVVDISTPYKGTAAFLYWLGKNPGYPNLKKFLVDNSSSFATVCSRAAETMSVSKQDDFMRTLRFKLKKETTLEDE